MGSLKSVALVGALAILASSSAFAADLLPPAPEVYPPAPIDVGGGWYLRGDVGVSSYQDAKFSSPDLPPAIFHDESMGSGGFLGVGVGYQFNSWLRADVTGEYRFSTGVKAHDRIDYLVGVTPGVTRNIYEGDYSAFVGLVNGYVDLGTWYGITPFIGAGVGVAYNHFTGFTDRGLNEFPLGGAVTASGGDLQDGHKTKLAYAFHAGLAYDVSPAFKVELAYRYLNLGEGKTGVINCYCGAVYSPLKVKDIESHDLKIGMRWLLAAPAPAYEPGPLIRKY